MALKKVKNVKKLISFIMITAIMFIVIEIFNAKDLSMTSQDLTYNFTTDALASLSEDDEAQSPISVVNMDPTTLFLLGSGLVGLAGFGRRKMK